MASNRRFVLTALLLVAIQVFLVALQFIFEALTPGGGRVAAVLSQIAGGLITLSYPAVGVVILLHRPEHPIGRLFCVANLGFCASNLAAAYVRYDLARLDTLPGLALAASIYFWPGLFSFGLSEILLLLFPTGSLPSPRWRPFVWVIAGTCLVGAAGYILAGGPVDSSIGVAIARPYTLSSPWGFWLGQVGAVASILLSLLFAGVAASLVVRWRRAGPLEREQLKWLVSAVVAWALMIPFGIIANAFPASATPLWATVLNQVVISGSIMIPIACGVAILRYHLYDIDLIIRRTLVYALLTAILALAYFGSVVALQETTRSLFGTRQNEIVTVASTLLIAGLFVPVRRRIQNQVDRHFYRRKYDAAQTLARFGARVRDEMDLDVLAEELVGVVRDTMQPEHVWLWLHARGQK